MEEHKEKAYKQAWNAGGGRAGGAGRGGVERQAGLGLFSLTETVLGRSAKKKFNVIAPSHQPTKQAIEEYM